MKEFLIIMILTYAAIGLVRFSIPSHTEEIHVGENMEYETDLDVQMKQELMLLK